MKISHARRSLSVLTLVSILGICSSLPALADVGGIRGSSTPSSGCSSCNVSGVPGINLGVVPEPFTILGSGLAIGFGTFFKRELSKSRNLRQK